MNAPIRIDQEGAIAEIVLTRPDARNAMTEEMGRAVAAAALEIARDRSVRAVLVRGEGAAVSAGGDLGFIEARTKSSPEENRHAMRGFYEMFLAVHRMDVPTIAVLHGAAMGAGVCFALACDIRLAARGTKLALNFVRLGLHPGMGATYFLPRIVGPAKASELLLSGRSIDVEEAYRIGLVNAVHPEADVLAAARTVARDIAEAAPLAVLHTKRTLRGAPTRTLEDALEAEAYAQSLEYASSDLREGVTAAKARRPPRFEGR